MLVHLNLTELCSCLQNGAGYTQHHESPFFLPTKLKMLQWQLNESQLDATFPSYHSANVFGGLDHQKPTQEKEKQLLTHSALLSPLLFTLWELVQQLSQAPLSRNGSGIAVLLMTCYVTCSLELTIWI